MKPLLIMLVSLGFLGCTTDSGLLVEINGERGLEDLERYRVTVVASQNNPCPNEDGSCLDPFVAYTCRPVTRNFKDEAKDFPIPILIRPGR